MCACRPGVQTLLEFVFLTVRVFWQSVILTYCTNTTCTPTLLQFSTLENDGDDGGDGEDGDDGEDGEDSDWERTLQTWSSCSHVALCQFLFQMIKPILLQHSWAPEFGFLSDSWRSAVSPSSRGKTVQIERRLVHFVWSCIQPHSLDEKSKQAWITLIDS